jgi:KaiC/GvpD/RAD55 family RecA-like ATPase
MNTIEYNLEMQTLFLRIMVSDASIIPRVVNIYNSDNFHKQLRPAAKFIIDFVKKYSSIPDSLQIHASTGIKIDFIDGLRDSDIEFCLDEFEQFTKRQELERAILKSAEFLEKGNYDPVEKLIKDAVQISLTKDMGTDYFADPRARLMKIRNNNGQISTGWPCLDNKLYGGFNRGELQIFAGGSGSGKSLFMQNLSVNWAQMGLNGVYISLELSEELCAMRIDSMLTDVGQKEVFKNLDDVEMKVKMTAKKSGRFWIKYMPAQSTVNDIRAYIKTLQIETGVRVDFLCVDYLDLLMPVSTKVSPSDLFVKDKYVSEEIRNIAKELNVLLVTASQLNRSAVEEIEFDHSHISGGISKINTADNVFGIFTSRTMRERGQYQIQLMKTRSSSGVGQKIDLSFNVDTLRIFDDGDSTGTVAASQSASSILNKIKTSSSVVTNAKVDPETGEITPAESTQKIVGDSRSSMLHSMLNQLRKT